MFVHSRFAIRTIEHEIHAFPNFVVVDVVCYVYKFWVHTISSPHDHKSSKKKHILMQKKET